MVILKEHFSTVNAALYREGTQIAELATVGKPQELGARELVVLIV
jgi:hypothetical protein